MARMAHITRDDVAHVARLARLQLTDEELGALVAEAIAETGATGPRAIGQVMKAVSPKVAGRAEGGRVAAEVKRRLAESGG